MVVLPACGHPGPTSPGLHATPYVREIGPSPLPPASPCEWSHPTVQCAETVAKRLDLAVLWMPTPDGWFGEGGLTSTSTGIQPAVAERLSRGGLDLTLESGDVGVMPSHGQVHRFRWGNTPVVIRSGYAGSDPLFNTADSPKVTWFVFGRWTHQGTSYQVRMEAIPSRGRTGGLRRGRGVLLRLFREDFRYARPS
jgi:hypothetical protein